MPQVSLLRQQLDNGGLWADEQTFLNNLIQALQAPQFFVAPLRLSSFTKDRLCRVRGEFIASLITYLTPFFTTRTQEAVRYTELHLRALEIENELNLSEFTLPFPLRFIGCTFKGEINCSKSTIEELSFQECDLKALSLNLSNILKGIHIKDSLLRGPINLAETVIGGSLLIEGGPNQDAASLESIWEINAEELRVKHSIKLIDLHGKGYLNFRACQIDSDFVLSKCRVVGEDSGAILLNLDNSIIKGDVHLLQSALLQKAADKEAPQEAPALSAMHMRVRGNFEVRALSWNTYLELSSLEVLGNLTMRGLTMRGATPSPRAYALLGKGMRVRGQLLIDGQDEKAPGQLWGGLHLPGATIGMDAHIQNLHIEAPGHKALSLSGASIRGKLQLGENLTITGLVRMIALKVQGKLALYKSHLRGNPTENHTSASLPLTAIEARGITIYGDLELGEKCLIEGCVDLAGLKVLGSLRLKKCTIFPTYIQSASHQDLSKVISLNLEGGHIQRELDLVNQAHSNATTLTIPTHPGDISLNLIAGTLSLRHLQVGTLRDGVESSEVLSFYPPPLEPIRPSPAIHSHVILDGLVYRSVATTSSQLPVSVAVGRRLNWISYHNRPFSPQPYEHYAQHLTSLGLEYSAIEVQIRKWNDYLKSYARGGLSIWRLFQLYIMKYVLDYGYRPWRSLYFIVGFILMGTIVFRIGYNLGQITPTSADVLLNSDYQQNGVLPVDYPAFNAFFYALDTFIPLVSMHIEEYWAPSKDFSFLSLLVRTYFVIHVVAGWFLVTAAIGGFIGVIKPPA